MALTLYVDGNRWRTHLQSVLARHPRLVPVAKGNGYGFGLHRLARKAAWLGVDTIAVGTYEEVPHVESRFPGDLVVLTPWRRFVPSSVSRLDDPRIIHTVSRVADLEDLIAYADQAQVTLRVVLERLTSMCRHGLSAADLRTAAGLLREGRVRCEGFALHLPLGSGSHLGEVNRLMADVVSTGLGPRRVWVSHLTDAELEALAGDYPDYEFRPRIGTDLWLGDRGSLNVRAHVQDVHPVNRGDVYGYRGRTSPRNGHILVVSGGTAHGIGLESPSGEHTLKARAATIARGGLDAVGFVRSPFSIGGKQRLFAEPPHMQASMLFVPEGAAVPRVGDEVDVRVRFTATDVDDVVIS